MNSASNWISLREWNGSQHNAFEELCCQLASVEQVPQSSKFIRKGIPDAGIECFWILPDDSEWGWQSKFFTKAPDASGWQQIDSSVEKALESHPELVRYTVCLACDRSDARVKGQKSFLEKWNDRVEKWQSNLCQGRKRPVEFDYWGSHEIFERLTKDEHAGRHFFWFKKQLFNQEWFKNQVAVSVENCGVRYSRKLNIKLPLAQSFEALAWTEHFRTSLWKMVSSILISGNRLLDKEPPDGVQDQVGEIPAILGQLKVIKDEFSFPRAFQFFSNIREVSEKLLRLVGGISMSLISIPHTQLEKRERERIEFYRKFEGRIYDLVELLSTSGETSGYQVFILTGSGGIGKTHLFCHVAERRIADSLPTLLLLGGDFNKNEPWSQIMRLLHLSYSNPDEFLGALDAAAQAKDSVALILIDALNEGEGCSIWGEHLLGICQKLRRYPRVRLALSVRNGYEGIVIPEIGEGTTVPFLKRQHRGFEELLASDVIRHFLSFYKVEAHSFPLLKPEFSVPLFLKLICEGIRNSGQRTFPKGFRGITQIFNWYVDSINQKLSEQMDYDPLTNPVQSAIDSLTKEMSNAPVTRYVERNRATQLVNHCLPRKGYSSSLFKVLIDEGLLSEDVHRNKEGTAHHIIRFSYQRLSDHLLIHHFLEECGCRMDMSDQEVLEVRDKIRPIIGEPSTMEKPFRCEDEGFIEALAVQLPEKTGREIFDFVSDRTIMIEEGFLAGLEWRAPDTFPQKTFDEINSIISSTTSGLQDFFLDILLSLSTETNHRLNAYTLHDFLLKQPLPDRDEYWTTQLHPTVQGNAKDGFPPRLIKWVEEPKDWSQVPKEVIKLSGITLSWFLTSNSRVLRDRATKSLVRLLTADLPVLMEILEMFRTVDDPYVSERLYAVAYGCAMRSNDVESIGKLAQLVYDIVFKDGRPPVHILLRDYARGVIEKALIVGASVTVEENLIRPPYSSEWPSDFPAKEDVDKLLKREDVNEDLGSAVRWLHHSIFEWDFARYIIGTNSGHFDWTNQKLDQEVKSFQEKYDDFLSSLTDRQSSLFEEIEDRLNEFSFMELFGDSHIEEEFAPINREEIRSGTTPAEEFEKRINSSVNAFLRTLGKRKQKIYREEIWPCLRDLRLEENEQSFDLSLAQRWIFKRVMDLGWTTKRFGQFDQNLNRHRIDRSPGRLERIGKKYQWIAYHEFLAMVADNFRMKQDQWSDEQRIYDGPWQVYGRNIDPSYLLRKVSSLEPQEEVWWMPLRYQFSSEENSNIWLKDSTDLPGIRSMLSVASPESKSEWLNLDTFIEWKERVEVEDDLYRIPRKDMWLMLKSYIIKKDDLAKVQAWLPKQNFWGRWMPETAEIHEAFLGEFYWSRAFNDHEMFSTDIWNEGDGEKRSFPVMVTSHSYSWSSEFDNSVEESMGIRLPHDHIAKGMGLQWRGEGGALRDGNGVVIACDPGVYGEGPSSLLIRKKPFLDFLKNNGYALLWTVLGEKRVIGGSLEKRDCHNLVFTGGFVLSEEINISGNISTFFDL